jgi:predicted phosphate transport protein (TIGR00153 family)
VEAFISCIESSLAGQAFQDSIAKVERTQHAESRADDIRREIVLLLYGKALFPESRGDILGLIEAVDKIPNQAESVARQIRHQQFQMPADLGNELLALGKLVRACALEVVKAARTLFSDYHSAAFLSDRVGELESEADDLEFALIDKIFSSSRETADKILLRDMVKAIGDIADRAEAVSDRIRLIAVKRKI